MHHTDQPQPSEPTKAYVAERLIYNPTTGRLRWRAPQGRASGKRYAGTPNDKGYIVLKIDGKQYRAHRVAWLLMTGEWPDQEIDHINGKRSDNRWGNLRLASHSQNQQNQRRAHSNNRIGLLGVHQTGRGWAAQIKINGSQTRMGIYAAPTEAARVYQAAKIEVHKFAPSDAQPPEQASLSRTKSRTHQNRDT